MPKTPPLTEPETAYVEAVRAQELSERLGGRYDREGANALLGEGGSEAYVVPLSFGLSRESDEKDDMSEVSSRAVGDNARRIGALEEDVKEMRKDIDRIMSSVQDILDILSNKEQVSKRAPAKQEEASKRSVGRGGEISKRLTAKELETVPEEKGKAKEDSGLGFSSEIW